MSRTPMMRRFSASPDNSMARRTRWAEWQERGNSERLSTASPMHMWALLPVARSTS